MEMLHPAGQNLPGKRLLGKANAGCEALASLDLV